MHVEPFYLNVGLSCPWSEERSNLPKNTQLKREEERVKRKSIMFMHVERYHLNDQTLITLTCRKMYCMILTADNGVLCHVYVRWKDKSHHYHKACKGGVGLAPVGAILLLGFPLCYS